ncbi:MAG: glycosyltransferase family 39 protein [Candidatus Moranbacteria bacterium]|nr:glycosyltransferase family 39 protein [Candidatus Moranbacteria bacterium]MDD3964964.1 glycosyltransferase family 39 protein [Candidatus Moranbacteria bacterium]
MSLGFFLRAYHFSDWLHFELDQARDSRVIDDALSGGPGELTLLGPKAGGTSLRLAPGFYYLEYVSALLFGGTPDGMAVFVMVFSILSLPIFYLFIRRFFVWRIALGLTLLFSVSAYAVMYGRFAWNPNLIPFFVLLGFYALLRSVDPEELRRDRWFLVSVFSLALATHFHFLAFLALPIILLLFLLIKRPKFTWKIWLLAFLIPIFLYMPLLLNERETGGINTQEFFKAVTEKSDNEKYSWLEKAIRDVSEHALAGMVITTGFEGGMFPAIIIPGENEWVGHNCDSRCDEGKWHGVVAVSVFLLSLLALGWFWFKSIEQRKSDFLLLSGIWFGVTFVLFLPLAYDIAPRFFLLSLPLFFILLGLFLFAVRIIFRENRIIRKITWFVLLLFVLLNTSFLFERFDELRQAGTVAIDSPPDRILKERIRVTLEQQNAIVTFLGERSEENGYPVYMWSEPQYRRALKYLMEKRGIENAVLGFDGIYREGVYYLILRAQSDLEDALKKYRVHYIIGDTTSFGTLVAIELTPKPESIEKERQDFSKTETVEVKASPRYTWRELWERNSSQLQSTEEDREDTEDN